MKKVNIIIKKRNIKIKRAENIGLSFDDINTIQILTLLFISSNNKNFSI